VKTVVEKLGRRFDANKSGSVLAQGKPPKLTRIEQQDYVLHGEVMEPGPRRGPQAPQRTVAEQLAALGFPQHAMAASP
jgi:hypothetical protein